MNDQELRAMIRDSIARHIGGERVRPTADTTYGDVGDAAGAFRAHASFVRLALASGDSDGACLIEPAVRCNHCGYCLSYGH